MTFSEFQLHYMASPKLQLYYVRYPKFQLHRVTFPKFQQHHITFPKSQHAMAGATAGGKREFVGLYSGCYCTGYGRYNITG